MRLIAIMMILVMVIGCAPHYRSSSYNQDDIGKPITIQNGEVENIRPAEIEQGDSGMGGVAGAYAGGVAGSAVGNGKGKTLATVLGVVIGAIVGSSMEKKGNKREANEITVRLDDGRTFAVVQEKGSEKLQIGDRVEILKTADGRIRVRKAPQNAPPAPKFESDNSPEPKVRR